MDRPSVNDTLPRLSALEEPHQPLPRLSTLATLRVPYDR